MNWVKYIFSNKTNKQCDIPVVSITLSTGFWFVNVKIKQILKIILFLVVY